MSGKTYIRREKYVTSDGLTHECSFPHWVYNTEFGTVCKKCYNKYISNPKTNFIEYRRTHRAQIRLNNHRYFVKNKDVILEKLRNYKRSIAKRRSRESKEINQKLKLQAHRIISNGGKIICMQCGLTDINNLTLDHINGRGDKENIIDKIMGITLYRYVLKHPEEAKQKLQILCNGCNQIKYSPNIKPNESKVAHYAVDLRRRRTQKETAFKIISKGFPIECVICGQNDIKNLTTDHINYRDNKDELKGTDLYRYLIAHPELAYQYQLLCFGCNTSKSGRNRNLVNNSHGIAPSV